MGTTTNYDLPYPELGDSSNVPQDVRALAEATDTALASAGGGRGPQVSLVSALQSGVTQHSFGAEPSYFINSDGNPVLSGVIAKSGNWSTTFANAIQMPSGTFPNTGDSNNQQYFMVGGTSGTIFGRARVTDAGMVDIQTSAAASYCSIDGIVINLEATT